MPFSNEEEYNYHIKYKTIIDAEILPILPIAAVKAIEQDGGLYFRYSISGLLSTSSSPSRRVFYF